MKSFLQVLAATLCIADVSAFGGAFVPKSNSFGVAKSQSSLQMVDANVIQGAGVAFASFAVGIGMVAFTEVQGERAKERGAGLSDSMSTKISGMLLEDVEVSSVEDLGSLTSQLEQALRASGGTKEEDLTMTEEEKTRIAEEAEDGW